MHFITLCICSLICFGQGTSSDATYLETFYPIKSRLKKCYFKNKVRAAVVDCIFQTGLFTAGVTTV